LVGVLPDSLEVHSFEPWIQIQSVEAIKVKHLCSVTGKRGVLFAASPSQIWRLTSIPVHVQLPALMSEKLFGLATKLAVSLCYIYAYHLCIHCLLSYTNYNIMFVSFLMKIINPLAKSKHHH